MTANDKTTTQTNPSRRRFLQTTAVTGAAATIPYIWTSSMLGLKTKTANQPLLRSELGEAADGTTKAERFLGTLPSWGR